MLLITSKYFKSPAGILRLLCLVLVYWVIALSFYSHLSSHWTFHARSVSVQEGQWGLLVKENGYEDCLDNSHTYMVFHQSGFVDAEHHYLRTSSMVCPPPAVEVFVIVTTLAIFLLSFGSLLFICCGVRKGFCPEFLAFIKCLELALCVASCLLLLIAAILYFVSAYYISEFCSVKAKLAISHYSPHNNVVGPPQPTTKSGRLVRSVMLAGRIGNDPANIIVDRTGDVDGPDDADAVVRNREPVLDHTNSFHELLMHYTEVCNLKMLTAERYLATALALLAAILYGVLVALIFIKKKAPVRPLSSLEEGGQPTNSAPESHPQSQGRTSEDRKSCMVDQCTQQGRKS